VPNRRYWGTHFFPLAPGWHNIQVYFRYLFMSRCGANSINVYVQQGRVNRIRYNMPPWMFARGSLKEVR
jgi:hypothetical protein